MKITVLDGYCVNPGDLSWDPLRALGDVEVFDRTPQQKIVERAAGAAIVLSKRTPISAAVIDQLPESSSRTSSYGTASLAQIDRQFRLVFLQIAADRARRQNHGHRRLRPNRPPDGPHRRSIRHANRSLPRPAK